MARINKAQLTKLEILQVASRLFLENGYSETSVRAIGNELDMSTGNITFYYPTKEHVLAELVEILCEFQWDLMGEETKEDYSLVMAVCLELATMAAICEEDAVARDVYRASYTSSLCLEIIQRNDAERARKVFGSYCPDWTDEQFREAEVQVSGIEYAALMTSTDVLPLEHRVSSALNAILMIFGVPEETRKTKIARVMKMDFRRLARRTLKEFKLYVKRAHEQTLEELLRA